MSYFEHKGESLFSEKIEIEKIRSNSASLVNWLVVTPIVLGLLFLFFWSGLIPNR